MRTNIYYGIDTVSTPLNDRPDQRSAFSRISEFPELSKWPNKRCFTVKGVTKPRGFAKPRHTQRKTPPHVPKTRFLIPT